MSTNKDNNNNNNNNMDIMQTMNKSKSSSNKNETMTRMHPSMKRPRAPIACYRCHHKKVRCDGIHPNCTRCLSTGVLCAYPSSRRSRNTQPTNVDPFIDNLSQLEARIRKIETDLEAQRALVRSVCMNDSTNNTALTSRILKTEQELQESRSIVAQLRLRGEQRVARGRRAAAAQAASNSNDSSGKLTSQKDGNNTGKQRVNKLRNNSTSSTKKDTNKPYQTPLNDQFITSPPFYLASNQSPTNFNSYYFPTDMSMCSTNNTNFNTFQDWSFTSNDISTNQNNEFVDPMIIATAEHGIHPSILSTMLVDEETSIMAARAKTLSHLSTNNNGEMIIPGLQPSSSSTSTSSTASFGFYQPFMDQNEVMMMDTNQQILQQQ